VHQRIGEVRVIGVDAGIQDRDNDAVASVSAIVPVVRVGDRDAVGQRAGSATVDVDVSHARVGGEALQRPATPRDPCERWDRIEPALHVHLRIADPS
jgi:hypothetical protein